MAISPPEQAEITNLFPNPNFETTSGTVVVWENYALTSRGDSNNFGTFGVGSGDPSYDVHWVTNADDGPFEEITSYGRSTAINPATSGSGGWSDSRSNNPISGVAGDSVTMSVFMRYKGEDPDYRVMFRVYLFKDGVEVQRQDVPYDLEDDAWMRLDNTQVATDDFDSVRFWAYFTLGDKIAPGSTLDITGKMVTKLPVPVLYFDSLFAEDVDLTPEERSGGGAQLVGKWVAGVSTSSGGVPIQSAQWSRSGEHSLRIIKTNNKTAMAFIPSSAIPSEVKGALVWRYQPKELTPNSPWFGRVGWDGAQTEPATQTEELMRVERDGATDHFYLSGHFTEVGESVWYDLLTLVDTENYDGPPFSGDTDPFVYNDQAVEPYWNGDPNYSSSSFKYYKALGDWDRVAQWDLVGKRFYEIGVDRGMLYLENQPGVPWSGLISVIPNAPEDQPTHHFIDGVKYHIHRPKTEFKGAIEAFTYPEQFEECIGNLNADGRFGLIIHDQEIKPFHFAYRTLIGNDIDSEEHGYKLHIIYNAYATPAQTGHTTVGETQDPSIFSWNIDTKPVVLPGYRPTSRITIDSTKTNPRYLESLEKVLYGSDGVDPELPSIEEVLSYLSNATFQ